jgi:hypothetical protein
MVDRSTLADLLPVPDLKVLPDRRDLLRYAAIYPLLFFFSWTWLTHLECSKRCISMTGMESYETSAKAFTDFFSVFMLRPIDDAPALRRHTLEKNVTCYGTDF